VTIKPIGRRAPAPAPAPDEAGELVDPAEFVPPDPTALQIDELLTELAGTSDAVVNVYRLKKAPTAGQSSYEYVAKYPVDTFTLDLLRDEHEGGDFRLYVNRGRELVKRLRVSVAPPKAKPAAPAAPGVDIAAAMREGFAQQSQLLRELARPAPVVDIPALIAAAGGMIQTLQRAATPPAPMVAPAPAPADPLGRVESMINLLQKGIELGQSTAGAGEEGGFLGIMRELIRSPMVTEAARQIANQARQAAAVPAAPAPAPGMTVPPLPGVRPAPPNGANAVDQAYRMYAPMLVQKAMSNSDPNAYAFMILDNLAPHQVRQIIERPDWFEWLCTMAPDAAHYRPWFDELYAELVRGYQERLATTNNGARAEGADPEQDGLTS
jgi:hypothetical protein